MKPAPLLLVAGAVLGLAALYGWAPKSATPAGAVVGTAASAGVVGAIAVPPEPVAERSPPLAVAAAGESNDGRTAPKPSDDEAQEQDAQAGLAYLNRIRAIPGAAPLLDDIVAYLKQDDGSDFSLDGLATDANGLAIVDQSSNRQMIKNPEILAKWEKLMKLMAADGEK